MDKDSSHDFETLNTFETMGVKTSHNFNCTDNDQVDKIKSGCKQYENLDFVDNENTNRNSKSYLNEIRTNRKIKSLKQNQIEIDKDEDSQLFSNFNNILETIGTTYRKKFESKSNKSFNFNSAYNIDEIKNETKKVLNNYNFIFADNSKFTNNKTSNTNDQIEKKYILSLTNSPHKSIKDNKVLSKDLLIKDVYINLRDSKLDKKLFYKVNQNQKSENFNLRKRSKSINQ